jgi:hypothetical protein
MDPPDPVVARDPPILTLPPIPTPPATTSAPVVVLVDTAEPVINNDVVAVTTPATLVHAVAAVL